MHPYQERHGAGDIRPDPTTMLWVSIGSTLCCCLPLGVVGIVYSALAMGARDRGDVVLAEQYSGTAKGWVIASVVLGLLVILCSTMGQTADSPY